MCEFHRQTLNKFIDHFLDYVKTKCENIELNEQVNFEVLISKSFIYNSEINGSECYLIKIDLDFLNFIDFSKLVDCMSRYYDSYKRDSIVSYIISWFKLEISIFLNK